MIDEMPDDTSYLGKEDFQELLEARTYWVFRVLSDDWLFCMDKLKREVVGEEHNEELFFMGFSSRAYYFFFKRSAVPPERVAHMLGLEREEVEKARLFTLKQVAPPCGKRPTVYYWGEA